MDRRKPIVITDSSDSDDCRIDESRSAPRHAQVHDSSQSCFDQSYPRMRAPTSKYPKIFNRLESAVYIASLSEQTPTYTNKASPPPKRPLAHAAPAATKPNPCISKQPPAERDYSNRHVAARGGRRCRDCIMAGRSCDGANPCASCFDPGFACVYPLEGSEIPQKQVVTEARRRTGSRDVYSRDSLERERSLHHDVSKKDIARQASSSNFTQQKGEFTSSHIVGASLQIGSDSSYQTRHAAKMDIQHARSGAAQQTRSSEDTLVSDDASANYEYGADKKASLNIERVEALHSLDLEQIPESTWRPNSLEEVERLILTHEANIQNHREYIVEAQLMASKMKTQKNIHFETEKRGANPFKKMIADKTDASIMHSAAEILNFKIKSRRGDFTSLRIPAGHLGEDKAAHIPEYKSIGRLRSTFLARNVHGLKYVPYHAGIEEKDLSQRKHDLETHFKDHSIEEFRRQRECLELVYQWSDDFEKIMQELGLSKGDLTKWMLQSTMAKCQRCQTAFAGVPDPVNYSSKFDASRDIKQRCCWLYEAFARVIKIGIWHFLEPRPGELEKNSSFLTREPGRNTKEEHSLCSLCFTHNCMTHGSYVDSAMTDDAGEAMINDPEEQNNERRRTVLRVGGRNLPHHVCGLYCLGSSSPGIQNAHKILGIDENGNLSGLRNESITMLSDLGPFRGTESCTNRCFINREDRPLRPDLNNRSFLDAFDTRRPLITSMSKLYKSHVRLPCMIAKIAKIDCMLAFYLLLQVYERDHVPVTEEATTSTQPTLDPRKIPVKAGNYNTAKSTSLENRKSWAPCSHEGPCLSSNIDCSCAREQVHCEKSCGCSDGCRRRFRGCRCKKRCFLDDRCECYAANRECDPQLCHECGVEEVLDPSNKYREEIRIGRCRNNRLQLDLPPRTVKGMSEVQGWGLFLGEDLPSNSFVGEYKGESISASESDRRGAIYAYVSQEYLFNLNRDHQLDGSRFGNKTRFINNSKAREFINVFPKVMLVNGVTRIGLFTNRAIKAGEELLYDYGYPADLVQGEFWEKHERAIEHNGVVTPIAKPKFRPRMAKNAVDTPGNDDEDSPVRKGAPSAQKKKKKRKRRANVEIEDSDGAMEVDAGVQEAVVEVQNDTDSSEYAESSAEMSSQGSAEEELDESEDELSIPIKPIDRRRGGEAQRRAAQTRKLNKLRRGL